MSGRWCGERGPCASFGQGRCSQGEGGIGAGDSPTAMSLLTRGGHGIGASRMTLREPWVKELVPSLLYYWEVEESLRGGA